MVSTWILTDGDNNGCSDGLDEGANSEAESVVHDEIAVVESQPGKTIMTHKTSWIL